MYDLKNDPSEVQNLASDASQIEQLKAMRKRYDEYVKQLGPFPVNPLGKV